ncbi:flavin reductase family protein [Devosia sp.]|uniref:flavin reductase family protein n=1 Tax=Devosia sp. TaxID=1871048 RepID=UPI002EFB89D2
MKIVASALDRDRAYKLLTGVIVPRPIAWVTTLSLQGVVNLAPFSAFTLVSSEPPMVGMSISRKNGVLKDTARNIRQRREFVVNIVDDTMADKVHMSGTEFAPETSEVDVLGLDLLDGEHVGVPRLAAAQASLECRFSTCVNFGRGDSEFTVGEVLAFHVRDELYCDGKIDTARLRPLCRIAGPSYAAMGAVTTLAPTYRSPHRPAS